MGGEAFVLSGAGPAGELSNRHCIAPPWRIRHQENVGRSQTSTSAGVGLSTCSVLTVVASLRLARVHKSVARLRSRRIVRRRQSGRTDASTTAQADMSSPFEDEAAQDAVAPEKDSDKPKLPLTLENVEIVLDDVRPYLRSDGGDCKVVDIDGSVVKLELQGACSSCSASSVTMKMGIEKTLMERIPEVSEVVSVMPDREPLNEEGVEEVLNGIRPFLSVSGGTITLHAIDDNEEAPRVTLQMTGPPLKSMAVRVEVKNRMRRKYPQVQDVDIVAGEGEPTTSA